MKTLLNSVRWVLGGQGGAAATVQTFAARLLIIGLNMATGIITARTLAPAGRGEQAAIILWPQFLAYAMTLGLPASLLYNLKRHPNEKSELFSAALVLGTALGLVATLTGIIFIPSWLSQYSLGVIQAAQWLMILAPLSLLGVIFTAALESEGDFATANHSRYLTPLLTLTALILLALSKKLTPFTAGLAYILPNLPIFLWLLIRLWKLFQPRWYGFGDAYKWLLNFGFRSYGVDLLGTLSGQLDQALVVSFLTPASMGMYTVALSLSRMLNVFQSSIVTVLFPKAAARPTAEVIALTGRATRISTAVSAIIAIAVMLFGPFLLHLLYGQKYMGAVPVFRILVIESVISGTTWVLAQAFMALGRPGTVAILQGVGLGLSVPLMIVLIPSYGIEGAGFALLGSTAARFIFVLVCFPIILKVRPPNIILTTKDLSTLRQMFP